MADWSKKSHEAVFGGAGEQPGSQAAYGRDIEIRRRLYVLQDEALKAQLTAIEAQREVAKVQREAIVEMRSQSRIMLWSVIGIFATALMTLLAAFMSS